MLVLGVCIAEFHEKLLPSKRYAAVLLLPASKVPLKVSFASLRKNCVLSSPSSVLALSAVRPVSPEPLPVKLAAVMLPEILILPVPLSVPLNESLVSLRKKLAPCTPSSVSASSPVPAPSLPLCHTVHVVPSVNVSPLVPLPTSN